MANLSGFVGALIDGGTRANQFEVTLSDAPIYIDDSGSLNILELRGKARKLKNEKDHFNT